jgi:hypothetical protein
MNIKISESTYKDINCFVMESQRLLLKFIPASGGKIQSIYDKVKNKEYLHQAVGEKLHCLNR